MSLPEPLLLGYHLYTEPMPGMGGREVSGWRVEAPHRGALAPLNEAPVQDGAHGWHSVGEKVALGPGRDMVSQQTPNPALISRISMEAPFGEEGRKGCREVELPLTPLVLPAPTRPQSPPTDTPPGNGMPG